MQMTVKKRVDIMLIAEGTYPYVRGGVSSWIDQLIKGLPHYRFGILFLGSERKEYPKMQYTLPENVVFFEEHFLFDEVKVKSPKKRKMGKEAMEKLRRFYENISARKEVDYARLLTRELLLDEVEIEDMLYAEESWDFIREHYRKNCDDISFIDYFWTVRSIHRPIWLLAKIAQKIDFAAVVHSPSTGYAGLLATLIKNFHRTPFILTEHGIYIRERKMDMHANSAFSLYKSSLQKSMESSDYLKTMWINFFEKIGFVTYRSADEILSLFNGAKTLQIAFGAPEAQCRVIPNGVDTARLNALVSKRAAEVPRVITLLGRVVAIKDIKTFIRAMRIVADRFPDVEGWITGPVDEDVRYAGECERMVASMKLENNIRFLGFQKIDDILPKSGILTLTSVSEGMPLVILEGFAAGLPCVATDVGSCSELICGALDEEDIAIGQAGEVVPVADASALANAYIKLLADEALWRRYSENGRKRVNTFYTQELFFEKYDKIYRKVMD